LETAQQSLTRLYTTLRDLPSTSEASCRYQQRFQEAMEDDFNTPEALAVLFELAHEINRTQSVALGNELRRLGGILGLLQADPATFLQGAGSLSTTDVERLIAERQAARARRDWQTSDRIRESLKEQGVILEDGPMGTSWRKG
jgi:cysteinyl-tRNA synthetase